METKAQGITVRRGLFSLPDARLVLWGDSAFSNAPGEKSQFGIVGALCKDEEGVVQRCQFQNCVHVVSRSSTVKRVVRSTLAAEAYAVSETIETGQFIRHVLLELTETTASGLRSLRELERVPPSRIPVVVLSDSENLCRAAHRDAGQVSDKRLRIVISMIRESIGVQGAQVDRVKLKWVRTELMVADALTKDVPPDVMAVFRSFLNARACPVPPSKRKSVTAATDAFQVTVPSLPPGSAPKGGGSSLTASGTSPGSHPPTPPGPARARGRRDRTAGESSNTTAGDSEALLVLSSPSRSPIVCTSDSEAQDEQDGGQAGNCCAAASVSPAELQPSGTRSRLGRGH